jgi:hypothetical protein
MAENLKKKKDLIKAKIDVIKKIADDPKSKVDSFVDDKLKDLPSIDGGKLGKKISDLESKLKKKIDNKTDIFKDLTEMVEKFLDKPSKKIEPSNKMFSKQRLKQVTQESIQATTRTSKQIIIDTAQKVLFAGDGICGSDKSLSNTTIVLKPKEFDFMNVLTIDPTSNVGQIVYEQSNSNGLVKMNTKLYDQFSLGSTQYDFVTKNNNTIFSMTWDESNQEYSFTGLDSNFKKVGDFLSDYYSNIEFVDLSGITKTAMMMTIQTDPSAPPLFEKGINDLNRLLSKILKACGNSQSNGLNQNTSNQFNENDQDEEFFFDFDDLEGIDLDDESRRYQKVLKFVDCGNLEVPSRPEHFEDFVYLSKGNLNDAVDDVLENVALSAYQDSGQTIVIDNLHLNLLNNFILNLPKALIGLVLSPKYILPIILIYKSVVMQAGTIIETAKDFMKKLSKFFKEVIKQHFWKFITEFWKRIKKDLLTFLQTIAFKILKKKQRRMLAIVSSLIALLTKLLDKNLGDCNSLFSLIGKTIDTALSGGGFNLPIPPPLLLAAKLRGGYSTDRAQINVLENLQAAGFNINPVFGERNMMGDFVKAMIDGHDDEFKNNNKLLGFTIPGTTETMGIIV